jgi:hypothetical protein
MSPLSVILLPSSQPYFFTSISPARKPVRSARRSFFEPCTIDASSKTSRSVFMSPEKRANWFFGLWSM